MGDVEQGESTNASTSAPASESGVDASDTLASTSRGETTSSESEASSASTSESESESGPLEGSSESSESGDPPEGWQIVHQAGEDEGALLSVWGASPSEVFAVGGQPQPSSGTVLRFDGSTWIREELPVDTPMLDWVFGSGERVWAVGRGGAIVVRSAGVWTSEASPTTKTLWGVWGADESELWAVGGNGTNDAPLLLRREGASESWQSVELPPLGVAAHGLFKVWGSSASDVWVVGDLGASLHYDGLGWTAHPSEAGIDLISVWGSASAGTMAAGGRASGHLARVEGESWVGQTLALPGLNGIWIDPAGPITVVGNQGTILSVAPGTFDYVDEASPTLMVLHGVFGFSGGPRFAVGGSLLAQPPHVGIIVASPS